MASGDHDTLERYRNHLKERLDGCFTRANDPDPRKRFARMGVTREILEEQRLIHLFGLLYNTGKDNLDSESKDRVKSIVGEIRGDEVSLSYCNALATLLYARCSDESLRTLGERLLDGKTTEALSDDGRPLPKDELVSIFGGNDGLAAWEHQSLFRPVVLMAGEENVYKGESSPLPFTEEPVKLDRGSYATVYKVKIAKGHLIMDQATGTAYNVRSSISRSVFKLIHVTEQLLRAEKVLRLPAGEEKVFRDRRIHFEKFHPSRQAPREYPCHQSHSGMG